MDLPGTAGHFEYSSVVISEKEIRVLSLLPGNWFDDIKCTLATAQLHDKSHYDAVSYAWGDTKRTEEIELNGQTFKVTKNLWLLLRRLREQKFSMLWIDAICIHQDDMQEKNSQVALMGQIYQQCQHGILWLGEDLNEEGIKLNKPLTSSTAEKAFGLLTMLAQDIHLKEFQQEESIGEIYQVTVAPPYKGHFEALGRMLDLPWWTRIWVVQEAALPNTSMFLYGSEKLPLDTLALAYRNLRKHSETCCARKFSKNVGSEDVALQVMRKWRNVCRNFVMVRLKQQAQEEQTLYSLRHFCSRMQATDPRDMVYSLLGLVGDWNHTSRLLPDYTLSVEETFLRAALKVVSSEQSLNLLRGKRNETRPPKVPQWIPDWFISSVDNWTANNIFCRPLHVSDASKGAEWFEPTLINGSMLGVMAIRVDSVTAHGSVLKRFNDLYSTLTEWMKVASINPDSIDALNTDERTSAFFRTAMQDSVSEFKTDRENGQKGLHLFTSWRRAIREDYKGIPEAWSVLQAFDTNPTKAHELLARENALLHRFWEGSAHQKFLTTHSGRFGIAPEAASTGDEIFILLRADRPFILRSKAYNVDWDGKQIPVYTVIDECYIDGIMDGEGLKESYKETMQMIALC